MPAFFKETAGSPPGWGDAREKRDRERRHPPPVIASIVKEHAQTAKSEPLRRGVGRCRGGRVRRLREQRFETGGEHFPPRDPFGDGPAFRCHDASPFSM